MADLVLLVVCFPEDVLCVSNERKGDLRLFAGRPHHLGDGGVGEVGVDHVAPALHQLPCKIRRVPHGLPLDRKVGFEVLVRRLFAENLYVMPLGNQYSQLVENEGF